MLMLSVKERKFKQNLFAPNCLRKFSSLKYHKLKQIKIKYFEKYKRYINYTLHTYLHAVK